MPFTAGERLEWNVEPGWYWLQSASNPEGAEVTIEAPGPGSFKSIPGPGSSGSPIQVNETGIVVVSVGQGSGRGMLARMDLTNDPPSPEATRVRNASVMLPPGECRSFLVGVWGINGDTLFTATAEGAAVSALDDGLRARAQASDTLAVRVNPDEVRRLFLQACAPADAAAPVLFDIVAEYPAPEGKGIPYSDYDAPPAHWSRYLELLVPGILIVVGLTVIILIARRW